jgi:hypothetical protein
LRGGVECNGKKVKACHRCATWVRAAQGVTEGFDTQDLKNAKTLLVELNYKPKMEETTFARAELFRERIPSRHWAFQIVEVTVPRDFPTYPQTD